MLNVYKPLALVAAISISASTAFAQATDAELTALLDAWVGGEGGYAEGTLHAYGIACLLPGLQTMPDTAKALLVGADGMEAGLTAMDADDPATLAGFLPLLQECVETLIIGERIEAWATEELPDEVGVVTVCMMDAVRPLPSEAKLIIVEGEDFEAGAEDLLEQRPDLAGDLDQLLEACD
ncbi:MAG: hypothetical protein ACTSWI_04125 [Alphaproteobacteria bacterium]